MTTTSKVAAAAVVVIAAGVLGLAVIGPGQGPGVGGSSASPTPSDSQGASRQPGSSAYEPPELTESFNSDDAVAQRADAFVRPFSYVLPADPHFDLGTSNETYHEVRVPEWSDAGHPGGLIVQAVGGRLVDPCNATSAPVVLDAGSDAVITYLKTIPELTISKESSTTVDGRPARQASVLAGPGTTACPDLWVWVEDTEPFIRELVLRMVAVEADGEHIAITIFGESDNPGWPALADEVIASFRFGDVAPSAAP